MILLHSNQKLKKRMNNFKIYKDDYKRFLVCPKFMWLMRNKRNPEVISWVKNNLTFLDKEREKKFFSSFQYKYEKKATTELDIRIISGIWFETKVIDYLKTKYKMFIFNRTENKTSLEKNNFTKQIIQSKQFNAYHQAYFCYEEYVTRCDLLIEDKKGELDIYEIKGVNKITAKKRRNEFLNDLTYQIWILKKLKYKVNNAFILHFDEDYVYQEKLDINNLYKVEEKFNNHETKDKDISETLVKISKKLQNDLINSKNILLSPFCEEFETNSSICTNLIKKINDKYNWLNLYRLKRTKKADLYFKNEGNSINLENIKFNTFDLTSVQKRSIKVVQNLEKIIKNTKIVHEELQKYHFPIYFYDFETTPIAIPKFKNSIPWLQIPFQYSIHVLINSDYNLVKNKNIQHLDFVIENRKDPRYLFLKQFLNDIGKFGRGTYVAYNMSFEKSILAKLSKHLDIDEKVHQQINHIIENTVDVKDFFKDFNIYHKDFFGSLSIKKILPALLPKINYKNLKIKEGGEASALYFNYIHKIISQNEWEENIKDLKKYCALDSKAMLLIYEKIKELVKI